MTVRHLHKHYITVTRYCRTKRIEDERSREGQKEKLEASLFTLGSWQRHSNSVTEQPQPKLLILSPQLRFEFS